MSRIFVVHDPDGKARVSAHVDKDIAWDRAMEIQGTIDVVDLDETRSEKNDGGAS